MHKILSFLLLCNQICFNDSIHNQEKEIHFDATRSLSGSSTYAQVGQTITGDSVNDELGYNQVYISDDGLMIAYSSSKFDFIDTM